MISVLVGNTLPPQYCADISVDALTLPVEVRFNNSGSHCETKTCSNYPWAFAEPSESTDCLDLKCPLDNIVVAPGMFLPSCVTNSNMPEVKKAVVGCLSDCTLTNAADVCCPQASPDACRPSSGFLTDLCPQAYSWSYDDKAGYVGNCEYWEDTTMTITFCPE